MPLSDVTTASVFGSTSRRWVLTGAAGFIGSHLLEELLRHGQDVVGVDNFSTGRQSNLDDVKQRVGDAAWRHFDLIEGDVRDPEVCGEACRGAHIVLHQAALGSVPRSIGDPLATNASNVDGQLAMLVAAKDSRVQRFVFASSSSVYGDHPTLPKVEDCVGNPLSPYAVSKRVNELYAAVFCRTYGLPTVGLRYFNVFGPRQDPGGPYAAVIPRWIGAMLRGEAPIINGDGQTSRDFCYVANAVQANLRAALATSADAIGQCYNIAVGGRTTLLDLFRMIRRELSGRPCSRDELPPLEPQFAPFRAGDIPHSQADISKAQRLLGYSPTHTVEQGIRETVTWYAAAHAVPI